jgi:CBS domain-containing protein
MKVQDLMTKDVLSVSPEASLKDVAATLVEHRISGMPVCDPVGRVLGVVSEADIVAQAGREPRRSSGLLSRFADGREAEERKANARTAGEAMTAPAITVGPLSSAYAGARLMIERGINRLPVVRGQKLVGIVTRADLVRAFLRTNAEIAREIREDVIVRTALLQPGLVRVEVEHGEVTLEGQVDRRSDARVIESLAARVPGVVGVTSKVTWRVDDESRKYRRELARTL